MSSRDFFIWVSGIVSGGALVSIWQTWRIGKLRKKTEQTEDPEIRLAELNILQELL